MSKTSTSLKDRVQAAELLAEKAAETSGMEYLKHVVIDSRPEPRPFRLLARPWQWQRANRIVPAFDYVAGFTSQYIGPLSFAETYPRGHDKTSFLGRLCNHVLAFGKKRLTIIAGAADEEQAGLITEAMKVEAGLNPWLWKRLKFYKKIVRGLGAHSELHIQAADAKSAFGLRGDIYILDEFTHWKKSDFWQSLLSGRAKMPGALFLIISNAGMLGSWQYDLWQRLKNDNSWCIYDAPGQLQSWMSAEQIEKDRKLLPAGQAKRLYDNQWIDPAEESGYLTRPEVEACELLGKQMGLTPQLRGKPGIEYVLSIDYGPKRDRTVLCVGHQDILSEGIHIDNLSIWQGRPEAPVQLAAVRAWIDDMRQRFGTCRLVLDPYQMEDIAQTYEQRMPVVRFEGRGGKSNYQLAECLRSLIVNRQLVWYPGCGDLPLEGRMDTLVDELCGLVVKQMVYGYRIDHELTRHDDRAVAIGMLCIELLRQMPSIGFAHKEPLPHTPTKPADQFRPRDCGPRILYGVDWSDGMSRRTFRP